ncbi:MAG: ECF transporter S component [Thermoprotei archaeon]
MKKGIDIIDIVVFTVAVYAVTIAIQIYQPATGGYFNLGEAVIYLAALIKGPLVAGIAGGVGAALADLSTGYQIFAPGTLIIKFVEGYVAGLLVRRLGKSVKPYYGFFVGALYFILLAVFATYYWSGEIYFGPEYYLGMELGSPLLNIPLPVWILIAVVIAGLIIYALTRRLVESSEALLLLLAGLVMVTGYFLYEYYVSNPLTGRPPEGAFAEIPVNIGQAVMGASIAVPLAAWLRRAGYAETATSS